MIVALPGLFSYLFYNFSQCMSLHVCPVKCLFWIAIFVLFIYLCMCGGGGGGGVGGERGWGREREKLSFRLLLVVF